VGKRRKGREALLKALYASLVGGAPLAKTLDDELGRPSVPAESSLFARALAARVEAHLAQTDRWLATLLEHWELERVGCVERCILRLALTELRYGSDVPFRVVIDEACELGRRFGDDDSVGFINGVLDHAWRELEAQGLAGEARGALDRSEDGTR
jgi:N utilization substance protein B